MRRSFRTMITLSKVRSRKSLTIKKQGITARNEWLSFRLRFLSSRMI